MFVCVLLSQLVSLPWQLIDLSMSTSDDPKEPYFFSVVPWIILHRLIKHEEAAFDCLLRQHMSVGDDEGSPAPGAACCHECLCLLSDCPPPRSLPPSPSPSLSPADDSDSPMLPSSLMLLNTAHEYLGRRSLCCSSDGALLKFYVSFFCENASLT